MPKMFYKELGMIAKHYRISEIGRHKVQRHYTVANCMEPMVYAKYLAALKGEAVKKEEFMNGEAGKKFIITAKNYRVKNGMSIRLNEADLSTMYEV